jgi:hypothetical protein
MIRISRGAIDISAALLLILSVGCAQRDGVSSPNAQAATSAESSTSESAGHAHDGWWCDEHGVPEEVCAQCNSKLAAEFQKKGDWCKEHDRPDSQCFVCHPELEATFAAQYEAKYGKKPPKPESEPQS